MSNENEDLQKVVTIEGELKETIVNYVGEKVNPEDGEVTLEMVIGCLAEEFPEVQVQGVPIHLMKSNTPHQLY